MPGGTAVPMRGAGAVARTSASKTAARRDRPEGSASGFVVGLLTGAMSGAVSGAPLLAPIVWLGRPPRHGSCHDVRRCGWELSEVGMEP